jgi:hypothetical protein
MTLVRVILDCNPRVHFQMKAMGEIELSKSTTLIFYVDEYKGKRFANIRKFVKGKKYTGATKKGIKLSLEETEKILAALKSCPLEITDVEEKELCTINPQADYNLKVAISFYNGHYGIDIRRYFNTKKYRGYTKKGIRIPYHFVPASIDYIEKMKVELLELPEGSLFGPRESHLQNQVDERNKKIKGIPDEYQKYF